MLYELFAPLYHTGLIAAVIEQLIGGVRCACLCRLSQINTETKV